MLGSYLAERSYWGKDSLEINLYFGWAGPLSTVLSIIIWLLYNTMYYGMGTVDTGPGTLEVRGPWNQCIHMKSLFLCRICHNMIILQMVFTCVVGTIVHSVRRRVGVEGIFCAPESLICLCQHPETSMVSCLHGYSQIYFNYPQNNIVLKASVTADSL